MNEKIWHYIFDILRVSIVDNGLGISRVFFRDENTQISNNFLEEETPRIYSTSKQLKEFFNGKRKNFDVPLSIKGTEFQNKVWNKLKDIPYGETRTYKEIAEQINSPKAFRAVGMANNKNPVCIITPCHRVVGSDDSLVGYAAGIQIKKYLLDLEKITLKKSVLDCSVNE